MLQNIEIYMHRFVFLLLGHVIGHLLIRLLNNPYSMS